VLRLVSPSRRSPSRILAAALLLLALLPAAANAKERKGAEKVPRYPPSFRLAVKAAIDKGVVRLKALQAVSGHWGNPAHDQAMGHTALPLLAMLKAGVPAEDVHVRRALKALEGMKMQRVYSVALYLMVIQALYQPKLDTLDTDVGRARHKRVKPKEVRAQLSKPHAAIVKAGLAYLLRAQNASGLWAYDEPADATITARDLSNVQYALLGLRAAADCGFKVKGAVWQTALRALLEHQDVRGEKIELRRKALRDGYAYSSKEQAQQRGFHYTTHKKNGPLGENTLWNVPATGSMTTAGIACLAICQEGLWRTRKFKGNDRKKSRDAIRDGLAWMQARFTVTENPDHPRKAHHLYYLYGLERMGMLTGTRWLGGHDWYKEGADLLLAMQHATHGGWGRHVDTSFGILFLKRATRGRDTVVLTD